MKKRPMMPLMNAIGVKTTMLVRVEAATATATSAVPLIAASSGVIPRCTSRLMFSMMTIAFVTSVPIEIPRARSDITLSVNPDRSMRKNVAITDTGIESAATTVCCQLWRKTRRRRAVSTIPIMTFVSTSLTEARTKGAKSLVIVISISSSRTARSSSRAR